MCVRERERSSNCLILYSIGTMLARKPLDPLDGAPFVAGCVTILRQFHSDNTEHCLTLMGQHIRSVLECYVTLRQVACFNNLWILISSTNKLIIIATIQSEKLAYRVSVICSVFYHSKDKIVEVPQEVISSLCFLEEFAHYSHLPRRVSLLHNMEPLHQMS